jgi:hypothetical protein
MAYNSSMVKVSRLIDRFLQSLSKTGWLVWFFCLLAPVIFTACRQTSDAEDIKHTRDPDAPDLVLMATTEPIAQPSATPVVTVGDIEQPMPTVTLAALSTEVIVLATPTKAACAYTYFFAPAPEACPMGEPLISAAAEQPFERGFMIWFEATHAIYIFDWDGRWQQFVDTFVEGQPENDPAISPPPGLYQPVRGFGKVWREHPQVQDQLGWALGRELAYESTFQKQDEATVGAEVSFFLAFNGQVLALTNRGSDGGDWVIAAS